MNVGTFMFCPLMADITSTCCLGAPALARAQLKAEVFKTIDGNIIVENEFLHFLAMSIRT